MKTLAVLILVGFLGGCANDAVRDDDRAGQSGQGKDSWILEFHEDGKPKSIEVDLGRDKDNLALTIDSPVVGRVTYTVGTASGVEQAIVRAQVEAVIAEWQAQTIKDITTAVIEGLKVAGGVPGL